VHLADIQRAVDERFGAGDREMGAGFLALVLAEELGELAEALRKGDRAHAGKEAIDCLFVALSIANALDVDAEAALRAKFLDRPKDEVASTWDDVTWRK
jgi:NTP pyrophosphatase (non-canonical NTP hydrolase)